MFGILSIPMVFSWLFYADNKETSKALVAEMQKSNSQLINVIKENQGINIAREAVEKLLTQQVEESHEHLAGMKPVVDSLVKSATETKDAMQEVSRTVTDSNTILKGLKTAVEKMATLR